MTSSLKPVQAVNCPTTNNLVSVDECEECLWVLEVRRPWRHFVVKCGKGSKSEAVYE